MTTSMLSGSNKSPVCGRAIPRPAPCGALGKPLSRMIYCGQVAEEWS
jgi:hypothetical protein